MSRKIILGLSIVAAITMLWFVYVQIKWIKGAMAIRERQFKESVNTSLRIIANEIEEDEIVGKVTQEAVLFDFDSIPSHSYDFSNKNFKDSGFYYNDNSNNYKLENKTIFIENIVKEIIRKKINIDKRLNKAELNKKIKEVFDRHNINFDYQFAVITETGYTHFKTDSFNIKATKELFSVQLYPNDVLYKERHYLKLYFPDEKEDMFFVMPRVAYSTLFLILAVFSMFFFTLYIILRQKKLSEMKNDFINNLTHELKTPISTISLASQMLKDENIPPEAKDYKLISGIIDDETKRLGFQVEKILQMAIIERGYAKFNDNEIDVNETLNNITTNFALKIRERNGMLQKELNAEDALIIADNLHITNVFYNLIDNAIKYSPEDPVIQVKTSNIKNKLVVEISDKGIGIKKEDQKRVFNKFYRVSTGDVHNVKGFGLGLSYVKRIVDIHKGEIKIKSQQNKGTTFQIFLPLKKSS